MAGDTGDVKRRDTFLWPLMYVALAGGAGSGLFTAASSTDLAERVERSTEDRYYGSDAARDFQLRDERIANTREESRLRHESQAALIEELQLQMRRVQEWQANAPPQEYRDRVDGQIQDHERRLRELEAHKHARQ